MKHTKGKFEVIKDSKFPLHGIWTNVDDDSIPTYIARTCFAINSEANAELIADAFNTTEESGLTPSELLKQNKELFKILDDVRSKIYPITKGYQCQIPDDLFKMIDTSVYNHKQAINNAKAK